MIPRTTLEAAARVAAHAVRSAERLATGAAPPLQEQAASPFMAGAASSIVWVNSNAHLARRAVKTPVRGNEKSADASAGLLRRVG